MASGYGTESNFDAPYDLKNNTNDVVNNTDGSIVGYKYFNFSDVDYGTHLFGQDGKLLLNLTPQGIDGTIEIMVDRPWASQGMLLGKIELKAAVEGAFESAVWEFEQDGKVVAKVPAPVKDGVAAGSTRPWPGTRPV